MANTEQITITLPTDLVSKVHERVAAGDFPNASELVQQSLEEFVVNGGGPLEMSKPEFDRWLKAEVSPAYEAMKRDPARGRTAEQVRDRVAQECSAFEKAK